MNKKDMVKEIMRLRNEFSLTELQAKQIINRFMAKYYLAGYVDGSCKIA